MDGFDGDDRPDLISPGNTVAYSTTVKLTNSVTPGSDDNYAATGIIFKDGAVTINTAQSLLREGTGDRFIMSNRLLTRCVFLRTNPRTAAYPWPKEAPRRGS